MDVDAPVSFLGVLVPNSQFAAPSASSRPSGRLKRRAGAAQTQPSFLDLDTSVAFSAKKEKEDRMAEQRELYEELNRETLGMPAFKRARTREPNSQPPESQDIEVDEENDFVSKALRSARRTVKTENVSPKKPTSRSSRQASPQKPAPIAEEEEEEPEPEPVLEPEPELDLQKKAPKKAAPGAVRAPGSQVDRDEKFLQAIQKNTRKKQDMDELDKEFNQLRIPKPRNGKATWDPPDYSVLWDFDDNLRGNFIEVIRKDLFRKDAPRAAAPAADDGRPNFKKFKKVS
jgi:hypothetical protein